MVIEQKSFLGGLVCRFEFGENDLGFSQRIPFSGQSIAFRIRYLDIPKATTSLTIPNRRAVRLAYAAMLLFAVAIWAPLLRYPVLDLIAGLVLAAIFLAIRRFSVVRLVQYNTKMGRLQLLQDKQSDTLLDEIAQRRKQAFMRHYDSTDYTATPANARQSLQWLREQAYLTDAEFTTRLAALDAKPRGETALSDIRPAGDLLN